MIYNFFRRITLIKMRFINKTAPSQSLNLFLRIYSPILILRVSDSKIITIFGQYSGDAMPDMSAAACYQCAAHGIEFITCQRFAG